MALRYESRVPKIGAPSPSDLRRSEEQTREAQERALERYEIARIAASHDGSLSATRRFIKELIKLGMLSRNRPPARETIRQLEKRWNNGERSIADYYDSPRAGRPRTRLPKPLRKIVARSLEEANGETVKDLHDEVCQKAEELGLEVPSYYLIKREVASKSRIERSAARHGSLAAELDGTPQARYPSRHTHEGWALDEFLLPIWGRIWDPTLEWWVSMRADVILIRDIRSNAIVGYHVVDPSERVPDDESPVGRGFDSVDVLAALLSAACPEIAPDATCEFAGYLPHRLRWDNHGSHRRLRDTVLKRVGIEIDPTRAMRASDNGGMERRVQIVKNWSKTVLGHVDNYIPTDRITNEAKADPGRARRMTAGTSGRRHSRKEPIKPEQLHPVPELREIVDGIIERYNYRHVNRVVNARAVDQYHKHLDPRTPRRGDDLIRALEPRTKLVTEDGITLQMDGVEQAYFPVVDHMMLLVDKEVTFYADPIGRGIWLVLGEELRFLDATNLDRDPARAELIAKNKAIIARGASDSTATARERAMEQEFGKEGVQEARDAHAEAIRKLRDSNEDDGPPPPPDTQGSDPNTLKGWIVDAEDDTGEHESGPSGRPDPWSSSDPSAFVRDADQEDEE